MARKPFVPPTVEEVANYCKENGYYDVSPESFVDYHESTGWQMKNWKAAVRKLHNINTFLRSQSATPEAQDEVKDAEDEFISKKLSDGQEKIVALVLKEHIDWCEKQIGLIKADISATIDIMESPIECLFYSAIKAIIGFNSRYDNVKVLPQEQLVGTKYRADFVISRDDAAVIIECDGREWHRATQQQTDRDYARQRDIVGHGGITIRFTGSEIARSPMKCAQESLDLLECIYEFMHGKRIPDVICTSHLW